MLKLFTLWAGCLLLLVSKVNGQSMFRVKTISVSADTVVLDTLSIVPESVKISAPDSSTIAASSYKIDAGKATLIWISKPAFASVNISYRTFPLLFSKKYFNRSRDLITEEAIDNTAYNKKKEPEDNTNTLFSLEGLNKSGSISRSVGVGNNHDLALNSNMTLQLSGKISEDLEILAAISDDNIPIQPEGNTQQINDFDKVFIQLKRRNSVLTGGDFEIRRPDSYFMNFFKRTQGASFTTAFSSKGWNYRSGVSMAVAKGRSSRLQINGAEGNQGPYRITGTNGEQSIIVLSGTERVFVDGVLVYRGQENDYVIDYNTAEITFTAKRLITQNSRIIVEFEYSDKNYARSLSFLNQEISNSKLNFRFNYYNEQDNRNRPFLEDISDQQKLFLQTIGNNIDQALYPNVDTVSFNATEVLYKQVDTLGASGVFVYSIDPTLAKYRLGFSFVGANNGNYRISTSSAANGRVFEFVTPINGIKQGTYEPVSQLITPKKKQLITFGTDFKPSKGTTISTEFAYSDNDVNLFSDINNKQNRGTAFKISAKNELRLRADTNSLRLITAVNYENTSSAFSPLERYRAIEFERDFNLSGITEKAAEHLGIFQLKLFKSPLRNVTYQFNTFIREKIYSGYQNSIDGNYNFKKYFVSYAGRLLNSSSDLNKGRFLRQRADFSRKFKSITTGVNFEQEHNKTHLTDGYLAANSFAFDQYKLYLNSQLAEGNTLKAEYSRRYDKSPRQNSLKDYSVADVATAELNLGNNPNSVLNISATYRNIVYEQLSDMENENTLLGRIDYTFNLLKGFINSTIFYEIGPGREPKREFSYLEVITGQGAYAWIDYNSNGIKELNEFEIARYQDQARYIRIYQNTNEFINTDYTTVNYTLRLSPAALWRNRKGIYKLINHFSTQTGFKTERKTSGEDGFSAYNPFARIIGENLISDNTFLRNTIFFNRNNPVYGIELNLQNSGNKLLLINGFDTRSRHEEGIRFRWNIKKISTSLEVKQGKRRYQSELFTERNYLIKSLELIPELQYQFNNNFRWSFNGAYRQLDNRINNLEKAHNYKIGSDFRYNLAMKGVLISGINLIQNNFKGNNNTSLAYEMLEGLQPGNNIIWTAGIQRNITQGVQMNLNYEGRKSAVVKTIHNASIQFRAFF